jgi:hypothetical protein
MHSARLPNATGWQLLAACAPQIAPCAAPPQLNIARDASINASGKETKRVLVRTNRWCNADNVSP